MIELAKVTVAVVLVFAALFVALWFVNRFNKRHAAWRTAAERHGLTVGGKLDLAGEIEGVRVRAWVVRCGGDSPKYVTHIDASGDDMPKRLWLRSERSPGSAHRDITTGDRAFDEAVRVDGDETIARAVLDDRTRAIVGRLVRGDWSYDDGRWTFERNGIRDEIEPFLLEGVALVNATCRGRDLRERLFKCATTDPDAAVRSYCLMYLLEDDTDKKLLRRVLDSAIRDQDGAVRLIAARHLGDIDTIAALALDDSVQPPIRVQALDEVVERAASATPEALRAVDALVERQAAGAMPSEVAVALAQGLGRLPSERAEAGLVAMLGGNDDAPKPAAIVALGEIGSIDAVAALVPFRDRTFAFMRESAALARDAILAIQARAGASEAGALALAEGHAGLAMVEGEEA